jgi:hypothetical protein
MTETNDYVRALSGADQPRRCGSCDALLAVDEDTGWCIACGGHPDGESDDPYLDCQVHGFTCTVGSVGCPACLQTEWEGGGIQPFPAGPGAGDYHPL